MKADSDITEPIYQNSINRVVIIDKIEYFLSYQHDEIYNYTNDLITPDIGKFSLISKTIKREGKPIQYYSENSNYD
jgi:hypothetical protein